MLRDLEAALRHVNFRSFLLTYLLTYLLVRYEGRKEGLQSVMTEQREA